MARKVGEARKRGCGKGAEVIAMLYSAQVYNRSILPRTPAFPKFDERLATLRNPPPMLKIHNSLKREKQLFTPIEPGKSGVR